MEQAILTRVGYTPEISHGVLVEMAEHRKDLEKKTKPILDTLRSYQDLPPVTITLLLLIHHCHTSDIKDFHLFLFKISFIFLKFHFGH